MNSIVPHSPPISGAPGQLPTNGGGGKPQEGPSFDDLLAGAPAKVLPSPIEDHSPTLNLDVPGSDDPGGAPPPRPMRPKGGKGLAADSPEAGVGVPLMPLAQPDLRAMTPALTLTTGWIRPIVTPENSDGTPGDAGSTAQEGAAPVALAGGSPGSKPASGVYPVSSSRRTTMPISPVFRPVAGPDDEPVSPVFRPVAGPADERPLPDASTTREAAPEATADTVRAVNPSPGFPPVVAGPSTPVPISDFDGRISGHAVPLQGPDDPPALPSERAVPLNSVPEPTDNVETILRVSPGITPLPSVTDSGPGNIHRLIGPPVEEPGATDIELTKKTPAVLPGRKLTPPSELLDATPSTRLTQVIRIDADSPTVNPATSAPMPTSPISVPTTGTPAPASGSQADPTISRAEKPTPINVTAPGTRVELSASPKMEEAKIAALTTTDDLRVRASKMFEAQMPMSEQIALNVSDDGTPVAKEAEVVNATLSNNEKATEISPLPRRAGGVSSGLASTGLRGTGSTTSRQIFTDLPVTGTTGADAVTPQITATPVPEPTAARQVVKVETLLQNALSAGQSLRPNGQDHMEMRVRLGGGSEDVTVRLQVANDRMQVTFQTNSPEMRKALEHGWEQFSTSAAHASSLGLATPRFESAPASAAFQSRETDAQGFSFDQQNPRRQETAASSFDDETASAGSRRSTPSTAATTSPANGDATTRRWTGWA